MFGREAASCSPSFSCSYLLAHGSCFFFSSHGRPRSPRAALSEAPAHPTLAPRYQRGYFYYPPPTPHLFFSGASAPSVPARLSLRFPEVSSQPRPRFQVCILDSFRPLVDATVPFVGGGFGERGVGGWEGEIRWGWAQHPGPAVGWGGQGGGGRGGNAGDCIQINGFMCVYIYVHVCMYIYIYIM